MDSATTGRLLLAALLLTMLGTAPASALAWRTETVDSAGDVGYYTSLALDGAGTPRIGYYDGSARALKYAWYDGAGWQNETIESTMGVSGGPSLALDAAGTPPPQLPRRR